VKRNKRKDEREIFFLKRRGSTQNDRHIPNSVGQLTSELLFAFLTLRKKIVICLSIVPISTGDSFCCVSLTKCITKH
jgi:hypothetical protein